MVCVTKTNESLYATKIGNIKILLKDNLTAEITNVLYVENLRHNLLSVHRLAKASLKVIFEDDNVLIMKNSNLITRGKRTTNLYKIKFKILRILEANICKGSEKGGLRLKSIGHEPLTVLE